MFNLISEKLQFKATMERYFAHTRMVKIYDGQYQVLTRSTRTLIRLLTGV